MYYCGVGDNALQTSTLKNCYLVTFKITVGKFHYGKNSKRRATSHPIVTPVLVSDFCKRRRVSTVAPASGVQIAKRTPNFDPKCRKSFTQIAHSPNVLFPVSCTCVCFLFFNFFKFARKEMPKTQPKFHGKPRKKKFIKLALVCDPKLHTQVFLTPTLFRTHTQSLGNPAPGVPDGRRSGQRIPRSVVVTVPRAVQK